LARPVGQVSDEPVEYVNRDGNIFHRHRLGRVMTDTPRATDEEHSDRYDPRHHDGIVASPGWEAFNRQTGCHHSPG